MTKMIVAAVSVVVLAGCGASSGGADGSVLAGDSGMVMRDAGNGGGSADAGTTCVGYCNAIMANCATTHAQYPSMESCLGSCLGFPQGTYGATSGNNLECRGYHAGAASADPATHCPHAGPTGDGVCGGKCEGFCAIDLAACTGANAAFTSAADCATVCGAFTALSTSYANDSTTSGDSFACRTYHLTVAATVGGAQAATHCSHTKATSAPCQ